MCFILSNCYQSSSAEILAVISAFCSLLQIIEAFTLTQAVPGQLSPYKLTYRDSLHRLGESVVLRNCSDSKIIRSVHKMNESLLVECSVRRVDKDLKREFRETSDNTLYDIQEKKYP